MRGGPLPRPRAVLGGMGPVVAHFCPGAAPAVVTAKKQKCKMQEENDNLFYGDGVPSGHIQVTQLV
mgnify:CR=1 FL=1